MKNEHITQVRKYLPLLRQGERIETRPSILDVTAITYLPLLRQGERIETLRFHGWPAAQCITISPCFGKGSGLKRKPQNPVQSRGSKESPLASARGAD